MSEQQKELRQRPKAVRRRKTKVEVEEKKEIKEPKKRKRANRSLMKKIEIPKENVETKKVEKKPKKRVKIGSTIETIERHWNEWKEIFLVGTEWNIYEQTYNVNWDFDHLFEKLASKEDKDFNGKYLYLFGSTERKLKKKLNFSSNGYN